MAPSVLILFDWKNHYDEAAATRIKNELEKNYQDRGFLIKRDQSPFDYNLSVGMQQATHVIMLFSSSFIMRFSDRSDWSEVVKRDPDAKRGIIIPIRIESCDFSQIIDTKHYLDLYPLPPSERMSEDMFKKLHKFFEDALERWQHFHHPPSPPAQESIKEQEKDPFTEIADYPVTGKRFFNAKEHNFFFTGQEHLLRRIEQGYNRVPVSSVPKIALSGVRGSGKTQIAIKYAHNFFANKRYQHVLWIDGGIGSTSTIEQLDAKIKPLLQELRQNELLDDSESQTDAETLKKWLANNHKWLLIFDEIDEVANIFQYLPAVGYGRVLVTTCAKSVRNAEKIPVDKMAEDDAISFLFKRARIEEFSSDDRQQAQKIVQAMEYLPLAIVQVGEYLEGPQRDMKRFVDSILRKENNTLLEILQHRYTDPVDPSYPITLVQSWGEHFELLQRAHPIAADLLSFCAFFRPEGTYEKILLDGYNMLGPSLAQMSKEMFAETSFDRLLIQLGKYSFIEKNKQMLSVHHLLHLILIDRMNQEQQQEWAKRAIEAMFEACFLLPDDLEDEEEKQRWMSQLEICEKLNNQWHLEKQDTLKHKVRKLIERKAKWTAASPSNKSP
jgi:hypothetical protein